MADRALHGERSAALWLSPCGRSPARWWIRARCAAVAAFLGAQPALLYGYYLWGGVKEMLAATLVATGFGLATAALPRPWPEIRASDW